MFTDLVTSPRSPCCVKIILEVKPKTKLPCIPQNSVSHEQYLLLGSTAHIHCPSLNCQSDAQSPEVTWYQVRMTSPKVM